MIWSISLEHGMCRSRKFRQKASNSDVLGFFLVDEGGEKIHIKLKVDNLNGVLLTCRWPNIDAGLVAL